MTAAGGPRHPTLPYIEARIGRAVRIERRCDDDVNGRLVGVDDLGRAEVSEIGGPNPSTWWVPLYEITALWVSG